MLARCTRIWWVRPVPMRTSKKVKAREAAQDAVFGPGGAAAAQAGGHAGAVPRIARDGLFDAALVRLHVAVDQRQVGLLHLAAGEQRGQRAMRGVVLGHQNHAAGEAVQAMHDAGPQVAAQRGKRLETASSAFTSVPVCTPAPACTTMPAGLSMATKSSSS
jgi:hypothetical protein